GRLLAARLSRLGCSLLDSAARLLGCSAARCSRLGCALLDSTARLLGCSLLGCSKVDTAGDSGHRAAGL
ncbi:MAG TPA: hypothetical protein VIX73_04615, partial [Kofleriaceae bacterium]